MRRTRPARAAACLLLLASLAGCGVTGKDQQSVVRRRLEGEPRTLNPLLATTDPELVVLALVSRNLVDYDETLALVPGLAESVEESTDHTVFTVRLRPDTRWEDGAEVTADDVVFTVETLVDPQTVSPVRKAFFEGFVKAEKVDARTARVVFASGVPNRLSAFNLPLLPARHFRGRALATHPMNRQPIGNGPYRVARWEAGRRIELVRNTQYFGEKAPAEKVELRIAPDSAAAFQALKSGEIDESRLTFTQKRELDAAAARPDAALGTLLYPELGYTYVGWNHRSPLFSDARVRRALTMLVDREAMARTLYGGTARPANGPIPPGLWTHDPSIAPWPHDAAAAGAALDEAGFRQGPDGVRRKGSLRFAFTLSVGAGSDLQRQIAETIQQALKGAGIEATLSPMEWAAFTAKVDAGECEAFLLAMSLDPNPDLSPSFHSSQLPPSGWNTVWYRNEKADALMDELKATFDRARAKELYGRLARILHEDEPMTFLHNVEVKWGVSRRLADVRTSPLGLSLFWPGAAAWRPVRVSRPAA